MLIPYWTFILPRPNVLLLTWSQSELDYDEWWRIGLCVFCTVGWQGIGWSRPPSEIHPLFLFLLFEGKLQINFVLTHHKSCQLGRSCQLSRCYTCTALIWKVNSHPSSSFGDLFFLKKVDEISLVLNNFPLAWSLDLAWSVIYNIFLIT
jgi:hypothetical protein